MFVAFYIGEHSVYSCSMSTNEFEQTLDCLTPIALRDKGLPFIDGELRDRKFVVDFWFYLRREARYDVVLYLHELLDCFKVWGYTVVLVHLKGYKHWQINAAWKRMV